MKGSPQGELARLRNEIREFVRERNWEQIDSPKNLATALCVEAGELLEPFQWLDRGEVDELGAASLVNVKHEIADVFIYLIALADKLETDLFEAVIEKLTINRSKYPAQ
jgi:dCTP diphosphatase